MELVGRDPASVEEVARAIPARFVHGVGPPRSGVCGGSGRGDSGSYCGWSWSAAFRRVWRKWPGRFRLVLCTELVHRVPASVAEVAGAIPARFVHGVGPPRSGECGGRGRGDSGSFCAWSWSAAFRRVPASVAEGAGAIPARFVHGVAPPRSGECCGRGRGDSGSFCAWSWSAAFRRVRRKCWRKRPGRFRLVLCMELVRRVPASVAEVAGAIPARFVHGVGRRRSAVRSAAFRSVAEVAGAIPARLCMELVRRVPACAAEEAGAIPFKLANPLDHASGPTLPPRLQPCGVSVGGFRGFALLRLVALLGGDSRVRGNDGKGGGNDG